MKRVLIAAVAMIICVGVLVGVVSGAFAALVEGGLYASGLWSRNGPSTLAPSRSPSTPAATASPTPSASPSAPVPTPSPVLVAAPIGPPPNPTRLTGRIAGVRVPGATGTYSAAVVDVGTGATLFRHRVDRAQIPASTLKLLTAGAVVTAGVLGEGDGAMVEAPLRLDRPEACSPPSTRAAKAPLTRPASTPTQMIMATAGMSTRFTLG